jgi:Stage II sporulation protein E (SpoIIE)
VLGRFRITFLMLLWLGCCGLAEARSAPAAQQMPAQADGAVHITLGQSAVPLCGPWKFTVGDSPIDPAIHAPMWAGPEFDDSKWETVDLTPRSGAVDPWNGLPGYVPGWTARGHAGYWGYAWYRIKLHLESGLGEKLALAEAPEVDSVYQVFDNGRLVGSFGDFTSSMPVAYYAQPMLFSLPQPAPGSPGSSTLVLAFRIWMGPFTLTHVAGGFHAAPVVGEAGALAADYQLHRLELLRSHSTDAVEVLLYALLAVVAFSLILFDRSDRVYMWMGAVFVLRAAIFVVLNFGDWTHQRGLSIMASRLIVDGFLSPLMIAGWEMVWWVWFERPRPAWLPRAVIGLTLLLMMSNAIGGELFFAFVPHPVAVAFQMVSVVVRLLLFALLVWVVLQGIRTRGQEGWLVMPAILLLGIGMLSRELGLLHIHLHWFFFGLSFYLDELATLLLAAVLALLLLRRLLLSVHRQHRMALDVKQAQEVQQVILPEARTTLRGLVIESEYRPALEVGGDFFQIIPHPTDGSLLIVAGDVTGKGLKAGMLVALLVGAIRTAAETSAEPEFVLGGLNRRLLGRGDAQATCLALSIAPNCEIKLANAGHVPPYLNGEPVAMEGALPLGMMPDAEFSVMRFKLAEGDRLMLMSDGIVEATDADGHLFGFERVQDLLRTARSAAEVANAAQRFGQEDDISVISVTRTAVLEPALA